MRVMIWYLIASLCKESQSVTLAQSSEEYSRKLAPIKTSPEIRRIQGSRAFVTLRKSRWLCPSEGTGCKTARLDVRDETG